MSRSNVQLAPGTRRVSNRTSFAIYESLPPGWKRLVDSLPIKQDMEKIDEYYHLLGPEEGYERVVTVFRVKFPGWQPPNEEAAEQQIADNLRVPGERAAAAVVRRFGPRLRALAPVRTVLTAFLLGTWLAVAPFTAALAQSPQPIQVLPASFVSAGSNTLPVTSTSASVALTYSAQSLAVIVNSGPSAAFVVLGSSSVLASPGCAGNCMVPPGGWIALPINGAAYLAAITQSGSQTATLTIYQGYWAPNGTGGASPISGTVTANQGAAGASPWPVTPAPYPVTKCSGTVTTGGVPQLTSCSSTVFAHGWRFDNPASTGDCWISDQVTSPAQGVAGSLRLAANGGEQATEPGQAPAGPVYINCPNSAQSYTGAGW
jgi:hypothetical protein